MKNADINRLIALDECGVFPRDGETAEAFFTRVAAMEKTAFDDEELRGARPIPENIIAEGGKLTEKLFAFRRRHDPGFFLSRSVGWLWGGCAVTDTETGKSFFLLRDAFANRKKWFCYRRDELLAHELCHVARAVLDDPALEEYFAYRTSFSALRRALGDIFTTAWDTALFLVPTLLLPLASWVKLAWCPALPLEYFYALLGVVLLFFAIRSIGRRRLISRAQKKLAAFGVKQTFALLFRATKREIAEIGDLPDPAAWHDWLAAQCRRSLRWEIIAQRFCDVKQSK